MWINKNEIVITEEESKICKLDGRKFESSRKMINYTKKTYEDVSCYEDYIIKAYYDGIRPVCLKTGKELKFKAHKLGPWFKNYTTNAFPRKKHTKETKVKIKKGCENTSLEKYGVKNVFETDWCKDKIKTTNMIKYGVDNAAKNKEIKEKALNSYWETIKNKESFTVNESSYELDFKSKLDQSEIKYESPYLIQGRKYDFYISDLDLVVEVDGDAYHKENLINLTFQTVNTSINDFNKDTICRDENVNLIRIRYDKELFTFNNIQELHSRLNEYKYSRNYDLEFKQVICRKEYFEKYKSVKGIDKLNHYSRLLLRFIKKFNADFPEIPITEKLSDVIDKIGKYDVDCILDDNVFRNNCSLVGNSYLKSKFRSYWKTKYKKSKFSPIDAWKDDDIMLNVIRYRMGCNNSNEIFDFSLHQLVRGLSAVRYTASFFKPVLAASIYSHFLSNHDTPTVLDPCCGFGGRLLGFKSKFPNGKYIGCEPNIETYTELIQLTNDSNFTNVEIHNCKWEDFKIPTEYDLVFTSIPYFDLEIYSNNTEYDNFDTWESTFIQKFKNLKNCYVNMDMSTCHRLKLNSSVKYYLNNGKSHFSKSSTKNEVIVKIQ